GEYQNHEWKDERHQHGHLHVIGFDLLTEIFRRAAYHYPGNEHRQHDVDQNAVQAGACTAEDHFAQHDIDQGHHSAQGHEGVMPAVDGPAARVGGDSGEQRGVGNAEADLFAFHVAAR